MSKYIYTILAAVIVIAGLFSYFLTKKVTKYKTLYEKELQNVDAYRTSNSGLEGDIREFKMTIDDLRASRDSIDRKLVSAIDGLKVKDKNIEYLQYQLKNAHKTDTILLSDTLFIKDAHVDTILGDDWYNLKLQLDYPSTIIVSPTFKSEQYVIINSKKEFIKTPSKLFFIRWFQKKYIVVEVHAEEKSPYIINKTNKFIKVIK